MGIISGKDLDESILYLNIEDKIWETLPKDIEPQEYEELAKATFELRDLGLIETRPVGRTYFCKLTEEGKLAYRIIFESDKLLEKEYGEYLKKGGQIPK